MALAARYIAGHACRGIVQSAHRSGSSARPSRPRCIDRRCDQAWTLSASCADRVGSKGRSFQGRPVASWSHLRAPLRPITRRQAPHLLRDERSLALEGEGRVDCTVQSSVSESPDADREGRLLDGGGLFLSAKEYWLNGCGHELLHDDSSLKRSLEHPWHETYGGECPGVYYVRLQRDGWAMKHRGPDGSGGEVTIFEKRVTAQWMLRKRASATLHRRAGRGCY